MEKKYEKANYFCDFNYGVSVAVMANISVGDADFCKNTDGKDRYP